MDSKAYLTIVSHYESCLEKHGDSHLGVDWPNPKDAETRYQIMLEVIRTTSNSPVSFLDFGCGASHLYDYMVRHSLTEKIEYAGLDLSSEFVTLSQQKYPNNCYYCLDILEDNTLPEFDYIVMNGVFTEKRSLPFDEMWSYFQSVIIHVFAKAKIGIAFNVMSKHVDWERDDLFHVPFDLMAAFLKRSVSRHFMLRNDYGLYEYTVYVYKAGC